MLELDRIEAINRLALLYAKLDYILLKGIESEYNDIRTQIAATEYQMPMVDVQTAATIAAWQNR